MPNDLFRNYLREELIKRCRNNPRYSLRSFASYLKMDHSSLAKILNGKRPLGKNLKSRLSERLGVKPDQFEKYDVRSSDSREEKEKYFQLTEDTFQIVADWYHFAILELIRTSHFKNDPKWIARALGISLAEVKLAIERMVRCQLLSISTSGKLNLVKNDGTSSYKRGQTSAAQKKLQKQILEMAISALESVPIEARSQSSTIMAINTELLPEAISRISQFQNELSQFLSRTKKCDEVYNLSVSLYPITNQKRSSS